MQDIKFSYAPNTSLSGRNTELSLEVRRPTRELASVQSIRKNQTATIEGYQRKIREPLPQLPLEFPGVSGPTWQERYYELYAKIDWSAESRASWHAMRANLAVRQATAAKKEAEGLRAEVSALNSQINGEQAEREALQKHVMASASTIEKLSNNLAQQERRAGRARYGLMEALRHLRMGCPEHAKELIERALLGTRVVRRGQ